MNPFQLPEELLGLRQTVRQFMDTEVLPQEAALEAEDRLEQDTLLRALQQKAKTAGLWVPHLPERYGGRSLGLLGMCTLFREMGRSPYGAAVFHCDAPDQGNMALLLDYATQAQQAQWLDSLAAGENTSAFCMTEPMPGAGADPGNLATRARREGSHWLLDGHKWYSTGGAKARLLIVMARTSDDARTGATLFLVDRHSPGVELVREIPTMGPPLLAHREAEFLFHGVTLTDEAILGGEGRGFELAQARLIPARLTHCMRWLGLADRALELCKPYVLQRVSFGETLAHHQMIQHFIAESAQDIHAGNLLTWHCAKLLAEGQVKAAKPYSSMAKTHVARTLCRVLDHAIQIHGALGYSEDMPFSRWYRHARAARIADGPDEVHEVLIARDYLRGALNLLV